MLLFEGARAKIDRARKHTEALKSEFERFYSEKSYTVRQELYPETGRKAAFFQVTRDFPIDWPIVIGEVMHNFRSALDHAIYELTVLETGGPFEGTEFPVFEDEGKYFAVDKRGNPTRTSGLYKIRGINDRAKAVVKGLQPFEFRKHHRPEDQPVIALVHDLNIVDKHRTLHLCRQRTSAFGWRVVRDIHLPIDLVLPLGTVEDGTKLAEWTPVGELTDDVDMEFEIGFEVAFGEVVPLLQGQSVIKVCESLARGVERVLFYLQNPPDDV